MANLESITVRQISLVLEIARSLAVVLDLDLLLPRIAESACGLLECQRASVWIHEPHTRRLRTRVALKSEEIDLPDDSGIVGLAFTNNVVLNIPHPYDDPRFDPEPDRRSNFVTRNLLAAPMLDLNACPIGVIQALNKQSGPFTASDEALLGLLADQAAVALQRQTLHNAATKAEALQREMAIARAVQRALIPTVVPEVPGLAAAGWTRAASMTGGDCYDLWNLGDGRLAILVADASGHGIGPAMVVSQVRAMIRLLCHADPQSTSPTDPQAVLTQVNRQLERDLTPGQFVTAFLGFITSDGHLTWASAGHGPFLVKTSPQHPVQSIPGGTGLPLGIQHDCFDPARPPSPGLRLDPGGTLLVMSDGVFESFDPAGNQFGVPRVTELLERSDAHPAQLVSTMQQTVSAWHRLEDPLDDQTLVAIQRKTSA